MRDMIISFFILAAGLIAFDAAYGEDANKKKVITIGRATENVVRQQRKMEPIIRYLASRLGDTGIERGDVVLAGDRKYSTLSRLVKEGKIDIILESPFKAVFLKRDGVAFPILTLSRKGAGEYNSIIFTRKDGGISSVEDLRGRTIVFEDPTSNSSYFLPKFTLKAQGLDMVELPSFNSTPPKDKVGYVFAGTELNVSSWVFYKKVAAGALSNLDWLTPEDVPETYKARFKIIWESPVMIEFLVLVRTGLNERLTERIKEELLMMDKTEEGRKALRAYEFDRFIDSPEKIGKLIAYIESLINLSGEKIH
ncbi:MAG: phosphate/phosphite/phosphonate ABC transporter substrate-binding protein [Nitrospirae bacterium]|nr:phosphate/phosphite/phosphonate ABC transporter substrate-binding protein [Nitrospirota bacterium]MCL5978387.1 phosphate/phosphite/phosphonate ABC transporter substrate-binding protein [Nitrospirota bacterium]